MNHFQLNTSNLSIHSEKQLLIHNTKNNNNELSRISIGRNISKIKI